ncbi:MAG: hypothetical protein JNK78_00855 [Planctomycetes bacterium]|nr:hypothetical protein [Planctomycetota bacterium]
MPCTTTTSPASDRARLTMREGTSSTTTLNRTSVTLTILALCTLAALALVR